MDRENITWNFVAGIALSIAMVAVPLILFLTTSIYPTIMAGTAIGAGIGFVTDMAVVPVEQENVDPSSSDYHVVFPIYVLSMVAIQLGAIPVSLLYALATGDSIGVVIATAILVRAIITVAIDLATGKIEIGSTDSNENDEWKFDPEDF